MSKRLLWALLLIAVSVILLILNTRGSVDLYVLPNVAIKHMMTSVAFFFFTGVGVAIGLLLR
jgi:hypothetical protein